MMYPKGFDGPGLENLVRRLRKSIYGLKQAPRICYTHFKNCLLERLD